MGGDGIEFAIQKLGLLAVEAQDVEWGVLVEDRVFVQVVEHLVRVPVSDADLELELLGMETLSATSAAAV